MLLRVRLGSADTGGIVGFLGHANFEGAGVTPVAPAVADSDSHAQDIAGDSPSVSIHDPPTFVQPIVASARGHVDSHATKREQAELAQTKKLGYRNYFSPPPSNMANIHHFAESILVRLIQRRRGSPCGYP